MSIRTCRPARGTRFSDVRLGPKPGGEDAAGRGKRRDASRRGIVLVGTVGAMRTRIPARSVSDAAVWRRV